MGQLLPNRHPNKDFFVLDVKDASPKDEMASMEHPIYSLATKPDMRELEYDYRGHKMRVIPSGRGLATIFDKDIVLYGISKSAHDFNATGVLPDYVEMTAHECMVATNWLTSKHQYKRFEDALVRLRGTTIVTNIETGGQVETSGFGIIDEFHTIRVDDDGKEAPFGRLHRVRLKLSDFTKRAIQSSEILTISPVYFQLRSPIDRRLYELARKHLGNEGDKWHIKLPNLQDKVGSNAPLKKFRFVIKQAIKDDNIPDYVMSIDKNDLVAFRRRKERKKISDSVTLKARTIEYGRELALQKGYDFYALQADFLDMIDRKGMPDNVDGAFIGYIKKKPSLRQGNLL